MIQCEVCGFRNLDQNRFCGSCGHILAPIVVSVDANKDAVRNSPPPTQAPEPLFDAPTEAETPDPSYLLEDDEGRSHRFGRFLFCVAIILFLAATAYVAYQKYYFMPAFRSDAPVATPPEFAYERTPPMLIAETQLAAMQPALPTPELANQLALENISTVMRNPKAQEAAVESDTPEAVGARLLAEGEKYFYGRGVPANCKTAVKNFEGAAGNGNARAMAHLASMYGSGRCVKFSRIEAYRWFAKAKEANPDNTWYESSMDMLWRNMTASERRIILR